ncbi:sodium:solute symporter family protein [Cereibacter sphaeroides]|nr:sodium:solute symporter family protein [Cereibacter sphaeroides]
MLSPLTIWTAIAVFTLFGLFLAWRATRENAGTAEDYYLGSRNFGGVVAGLSYAATTYSAFMLVVLTGLTYRGGIGALGFELIYFAGLGLLVIFAPRFWLAAKRWGFISPAEMLGTRYDSVWVARAAALVGLVFLMPYCTTQMAGIGLLLSGVTGGEISLVEAVATGALLAAIWTLFAGLRSVAWTDAVQAVVMLVSAVLAILFAVAAIGGWGEFARISMETQAQRLTVPGPGLWSLNTFIALSLPWFFFAISNPQVSQRLFILKDMASMKRMIFWVLGFGLVFTLIAVTWGFAALQLAPGLENTATATPALLTSGAIPVPVAVLLILGILAAAISTLDSIALTLASMVARDVLKDARPSAQILTGRVVVILVILFAALFAVQKAQIVDQLAALSAAGLMVTVPAIIGAFFWRRATAAGALTSILGGAALAVWMAMIQGVSVFNPVLALSVLGLTVALFVVVSLVTKPKATALDFGAELRGELDKHGAW